MGLYVLRLVFIVKYLWEFRFSVFSFLYIPSWCFIDLYRLLSMYFLCLCFLNFTILSGRCAFLALSIQSFTIIVVCVWIRV